MVDWELRLLLPKWVRRFPSDLVAVVALVALALLGVVLPGVRETSLRALFGLPLVLFLPGYAIVSVLFPERRRRNGDESSGSAPARSDAERTDSDVDTSDDSGASSLIGKGATRTLGIASVSGHERVVAAVGLSLATVPMVVLTLNFTPYGTRFWPVLTSLSAATLVLTAAAAVRRWNVPPEDRFRVPHERWTGIIGPGLLRSETRFERGLNVVILLALLVGTGSAVYAVSMPGDGQSFTEFYVLAENESGELAANDFPTELTSGEQQLVTVGVGNYENRQVNYTVVVELQRVSTENGSMRVVEAEELHRFHPALTHNETWRQKHALQPTMTGQNLRMQYMLYRGDAPQDADRRGAYRDVHFWVNVTASESKSPGLVDASPADTSS